MKLSKLLISTLFLLGLIFGGCEQIGVNSGKTDVKKSITGNHIVSYVIDGDTIAFKDLEKTVRLVGIDTPESKASMKMIDLSNACTDGNISKMKILGKEASHFTENLILKGSVHYVEEIEIGKYGRIVGDIDSNGTSLSLKIVAAGYATIYPGKSNISKKLKDQLQEAYLNARSKNLGLWGKYPVIMECVNP